MDINSEKPSSDRLSILSWNSGLQEDKLKAINLDPMQVTKDQMVQLYLLLYPLIQGDFLHRDDNAKYQSDILQEILDELKKLNSTLSSMAQVFNLHSHAGNGATPPATQMNVQTINAWQSKPEGGKYKDGENLIIQSSGYAHNINHRNPEAKQSNYNPKVSAKEEYDKADKYRPFDIGGDNMDTGDNNFINKTV